MYGIGRGFYNFVQQPLFDDEGGGGGGGDVTNLPEVPGPSENDIDALAGDDDDDTDDDTDDKDDDVVDDDDKDDADDKEDDKDEEDDEVIDEGDDDKEKDEKKDDDVDDKGDDKKVPSIKALKAAYPDIFKKFPHVRTAIAEHQQFRNLYSSVAEAQEAAEAQENFSTMTDKIVDDADFGYLFDEVNKADPRAASRLARKILPAILERSKDLYMDITEAPITQFVNAAYRRARAEGNKNLENSALHIWKFLGKDGTPTAAQVEEDPKDKEFQERVREFEGKKFTEARGSVTKDIMTGLTGLIEKAIDPNNTLKETTKRALINELVREIDTDVSGDRTHMQRVDRLWANARRSSFATGHLSRIISAYLERAKQVLPKHARKVREENNITDKSEDDKGERRPQARRNNSNEPAPRPHGHGNPPRQRTIRDTNPRNIDWRKTSDEDVLGGRAVLKRGR